MKKTLTMVLALVLVAAISVGATLAFLTDDDQVVNTFTVGNVQIKLDEAKANADGSLDTTATDRVKANSYKLLPGHTYNKDPMVTVEAGSEECYVKMTLTYNCAAYIDSNDALDFGDHATEILVGYNASNWQWKYTEADEENDTRTITFWYKETVNAANGDVKLDALFDQIKMPNSLTNADLKNLENFKMTINAYAIQADGFTDAADAWDHYAQ